MTNPGTGRPVKKNVSFRLDWRGDSLHGNQYEIKRSFYQIILELERMTVTAWGNSFDPL
jgi:hypothetical protein